MPPQEPELTRLIETRVDNQAEACVLTFAGDRKPVAIRVGSEDLKLLALTLSKVEFVTPAPKTVAAGRERASTIKRAKATKRVG